LMAFGVTARLTAAPGRIARRALRGTSSLDKKPTTDTIRKTRLQRHALLEPEGRAATICYGLRKHQDFSMAIGMARLAHHGKGLVAKVLGSPAADPAGDCQWQLPF
jgi:hypothetical protein